jgi:uncharacterized protein
MQTKSERFELRLDQEILNRVDHWRSEQEDLPSRAEAFRRLLHLGLGESRSPQPILGVGERLILMMLGDISKHLKIEGEIDPDFVARSIHSGQIWGIGKEYGGLFYGQRSNTAVVEETKDILSMWTSVEHGYGKLTAEGRKLVSDQCFYVTDSKIFEGFDANNEDHYNVARYLIENFSDFENFKGRSLDSHCSTIDSHRGKWQVFQGIRTHIKRGTMNATQIIEVLSAPAARSRPSD